jgi:pilus assembly protein FimV
VVKTIQRSKFQSTVIAAAMALLPFGSAHAAGLGKLTVMSALGQPLRAELDISASREELASLSARTASAETFRQAGIEYFPAASAFKFVLDKRPGGQPYLKVTSDRAVNEPFLDVLVELVWSSGRMVREYTVLLDPPDIAKPKPQVVVEAAPVVTSPVVAPPPPVATRAPVVAAAEPPAVTVAEKPAAAAVPPPSQPVVTEQPPAQKAAAATHVVGRGDTLAKIAAENKIDGINLDQMLVALFRANEDAFADGNMNRLRVGRILNLPDREAVSEVSAGEARKVVVSQAEDFNAYRRKLAAAVSAAKPVAEEAPKQAAEGKITPKVEEKTPPPAPAKDKLEVSRTESAKEIKAAKDANKALQGRVTALEEDLVSRDRALKEASSRVADLEKNLADLKKLAELKSQTIAQMQQQAAAKPVPEVKKPEPAPAVKPAEVPPAKPVEVAKAPEPTPAPPVEPPKVEPPKAAEPEKAAEPPKPPVKAAEVQKVEPPPPLAEPSFLDENPELVYGGGGVLVVLLGYLGFAAMRRKRDVGTPTTSRISEGDLMANSVFGSTGGQAVDTGASIQTDFSQANLAAISADEGVDPVAEADVYMAYGRDAQAEEILLDALKNDPGRHAIYLKLLEIYSSRKSPKQFETIARDLHEQTAGSGPDWERAAAMGRALDPDNTFYGQGDGAVPVADMSATTIIVPPTQAEKLRDAVEAAGQPAPAAPVAAPLADVDTSAGLDFDLDVAALAATNTPSTKDGSLDFEVGEAAEPEAGFDPGQTAPMGSRPVAPAAPAAVSDLDFHFDLGEDDAPAPEDDFSPNATHLSRVTDAAPRPTAAVVDTSLAATQLSKALTSTHLDFEDSEADLASASPEPGKADEFSPRDTHGNRAMTETHLDLGGIDLNLDATMPMPHGQAAGGDVDDPDVATKIELAQAYEEMGDKEGARELLQEVLQEGSTRQRDQARSRLASLGG